MADKTEEAKVYKTANTNVYMHSKVSLSEETRTGIIEQGTQVEVLGDEKDGFIKVAALDKTGYCVSKYLD